MLDDASVRGLRARAQALAGGEREASCAAVVRRVFAIQAQDAQAADLGIRVRGRGITAAGIRAAYEEERSVVRGWFMRGTLHTIPSEDLRWVLRLFAPLILARTGRRYRELGLDDGLRGRSERLIRRVLATHGPLTRPELARHLAALGVPPEGQAPIHLIRHAALRGVLCHGPRRSGEAGYVLLDDWLPAAGDAPADGEAAAAELARRYLAAHAPAGVADFAAWSGLPVSWARTAWSRLAESGVITGDGELTVLAGDVGAARSPSEGPDVRMLPAYDDYLIGYRSRALAVPAAHQARVWPGGGVIRPTVVVDGLAVGTWTRRQGGRSATVDPFEPLDAEVRSGVDAEVRDVSRFCGHSG